MKIVIAPDSYKGSLTASEVCTHIENAIKKVDSGIEVVKLQGWSELPGHLLK